MDKCPLASTAFIVGGDKAAPNEFPHQAALGDDESTPINWFCGGTLIRSELNTIFDPRLQSNKK